MNATKPTFSTLLLIFLFSGFQSLAQTVNFNLTYQTVISECRPGGQEFLFLEGTIAATDPGFPNGDFSVDYYIDSNNNGTVDDGEPFIATFNTSGPINPADPLAFQHFFTIGGNVVCQLLARIDATDIPALENTVEVLVGSPQINNAGETQVICSDGTPNTVELMIGNSDCSQGNTYVYTWLAVPPASINDLDDPSSPTPTITVSSNGTSADTLRYVLSTQRGNCTFSFDEVMVILQEQIQITGDLLQSIEPGDSVLLFPEVTGGSGNYGFNWSPSETLSSSEGFPFAKPLQNTDYVLTVTDDKGCSNTQVFTVLVGSVNGGLNATEVEICEGEEFTFSATGGTDYEWVPFPFNTEEGGLDDLSSSSPTFSGGIPGGIYRFELFIRDENLPGLQDAFEITITVNSNPTVSIEEEIESCFGGSLTLNPGVTGGNIMDEYSFQWSENVGQDQINIQNPMISPQFSGTYFISITDDNGCGDIASTFVNLVDTCLCDFFPEVDSLVVQTDCTEEADFCLDIDEEVFPEFTFTDNGFPYEGGFQRCNFDTVSFYTYASLGNVDAGLYLIQSWPINGDNFQGFFVSLESLLELMNQLDPLGDWRLSDNGPLIEGGFSGNVYGDIIVELTDNGIVSTLGYSQGFDPQSYSMFLATGTHELFIENPNTGCTEEVWINVACTTTEEVRTELELGASLEFCVNSSELVGEVDSFFFNNCTSLEEISLVIQADTCFEVTGIQEGIDSLCMILCDSFGICDTSIFVIDVKDYYESPIVENLALNQEKIVCLDTSLVDLPGPIASMQNVCENLSGDHALLEVNETDYCLIFNGIGMGVDTACIEFCDALGNCDTIEWIMKVEEGITVLDSVVINQEIGTFCLDTSLLSGRIVEVEDICPEKNGDAVTFSVDDNYCVTFQGDSLGIDTACFVLTDEFGNITLTNLIVKVRALDTELVELRTGLNTTIQYCLDTTELAQPIERMSDACIELNGEQAIITMNTQTYCVDISGRAIGLDTSCLIVCSAMACDTTILAITVIESIDPPVANPDSTVTDDVSPIIVNIISNDLIPVGVDTSFIVSPPAFGTASINLDQTLAYVPNGEICAITDSLEYAICNINGCDTAIVKIAVKCSEIKIFTALSPNRDGINDVFYIDGIQDKPENRLRVYNRWGNLVFDSGSDGYQNNWDGVWEGNDLPDGTYFYLFEVKVEGEDQTFRGYLELFR